MRCPQCGARDTPGRRLARPRRCGDDPPPPRVHRRAAPGSRPTSGSRPPASSSSSATASRQEFDRDKLAVGLRKALTRRPVPDGAAEQAADEIEAELRAAGVSEVPSSRIGALAHGEAARRSTTSPTSGSRACTRASRTSRTSSARSTRLFAETEARAAEAQAARRERPRPTATSAPQLEAGRVRIDPYDPADLQPSSVDLHLDRSFRVFRNNRYAYIDVRAPQPDLTELLTVADDEPFILHPGEFVLGQTLEWVELPDDLVARLEGRVAWGGSACSSTRRRATWTPAGRAT